MAASLQTAAEFPFSECGGGELYRSNQSFFRLLACDIPHVSSLSSQVPAGRRGRPLPAIQVQDRVAEARLQGGGQRWVPLSLPCKSGIRSEGIHSFSGLFAAYSHANLVQNQLNSNGKLDLPLLIPNTCMNFSSKEEVSMGRRERQG